MLSVLLLLHNKLPSSRLSLGKQVAQTRSFGRIESALWWAAKFVGTNRAPLAAFVLEAKGSENSWQQ